MTATTKKSGNELFIVDNSDTDWKVLNYLREWTDIARAFDIATGYFEIGALLALDGQWQKLEKIRVLMGDEISKRSRKALLDGTERVTQILDQSIEKEKESNDFLRGVPAIVQALKDRKIEARVYAQDKFHAKAYITHAKSAVVGSSALVGSSNFTYPGLTQNVELNVQLRREVEELQAWYERHWNEAEEVSEDVLKVIERHTREYMPFDIYAKALQEFFKGHEMTAGEWELTQSAVYPVLDQYQKEGYQALMKIANQWGGAFLCDGVGLGKTFIGMMLIERLIVYDRKRVMLVVPKAARLPVWEAALRRYLPNLGGGFTNLRIFNHTDLLRGGDYAKEMMRMKEQADVVIIDEAHHFRNPGTQGVTRYWKMYEITEGKTVFFLTATPINNRLRDLQHLIELFSRRDRPDYFKGAPLDIHSLPGHFRRLENELERQILGQPDDQEGLLFETNQAEAEKVLFNDTLFRALVVQRSRSYVAASQKQHGGSAAIFPTRRDPIVAEYSVKKTYGQLLDMVEEAFSKQKPLFSLAIYYPLFYFKAVEKTKEYAFEENRQRQLVRLIRIQFLKRFESSARAFEMSCETLLRKFLAWVEKHSISDAAKRRLNRWKAQNAEIIGYLQRHQMEMNGEEGEELDEDVITDEMLEDVELLSPDEYRVDEMLDETYLDLDQTVRFLVELKKFQAAHDDKLRKLIHLLKTDAVLKKHKVIIFTEYMATAKYLQKQLVQAGIEDVDEVDSSTKRDRGAIIRQFAPYYNESSSAELKAEGLKETRVLVSTDVLSEGLNLQDATRLINYDLHWNPVRLMQRIGRIDRRMNFYHDESLEVGFWHGMLLVPRNQRMRLLEMLRATRTNLNYTEPISFKGLKKWGGKKVRAIESWLHIGVVSLAQRMKGDGLAYTTGRISIDKTGRHQIEYQNLRQIIGAKFILFRVRDGHSVMSSDLFRDHAAKVETTLRMGLKGGMHLLGSEASTIRICSFHFDGHEHYGRHIDIDRIAKRIKDLRSYCSFDDNLGVDDRSSDHRYPATCQPYDDCQFLQLTDLLVGAFRTILGVSKNPIQAKVSYPVRQLVERWRQGARRMKNSRWYGGFCVSQCYLQNAGWQFEDITIPQVDAGQYDLFDQQHESL